MEFELEPLSESWLKLELVFVLEWVEKEILQYYCTVFYP